MTKQEIKEKILTTGFNEPVNERARKRLIRVLEELKRQGYELQLKNGRIFA